MKYITLFETTAAYNAATLDLPNVSLIEETMGVTYNPYVEPIETRIVAKFNVTSTSNPTKIIGQLTNSPFSEIEIDDVVQTSVVNSYTFSTTGEHTVKYTLTDPTSIGEGAFKYCYNLTSINIPSGVTSISGGVFMSCRSLTSIIIPNSVTNIGTGAFEDCSGLTSCTIGNGVTSIGSDVFNGCTSLTSIVIPNSVTIIGDWTFSYCSSLTSCTIGSSVTSIGNNAFDYCTGLTSVTVNATISPTIGSDAFNNTNNCPIYVPSASVEAYKSASGWSDYESRIQAIP